MMSFEDSREEENPHGLRLRHPSNYLQVPGHNGSQENTGSFADNSNNLDDSAMEFPA